MCVQVCNHPELFERREARSPFFMKSADYLIPTLVFEEGIQHFALPSKQHLLYNTFSVFAVEHIQRTLFPITAAEDSRGTKTETHFFNCFSFSRLIDLSPRELNRIALGDLIFR